MPLPTLPTNGGPKEKEVIKKGLPVLPTLPKAKEDKPPLREPPIEVEDDFTELTEEETTEEDFNDELSDELYEESYTKQPISIDDPFEDRTEIPSDSSYVDKKKRKIKPFGAPSTKKKKARREKAPKKTKIIRAKDFDERKNELAITRVAQVGTMAVVLGLFGFGIKNTFFPSNSFSEGEIEQIALNSMGETGFPLEQGRSFAEQFAEVYLTTSTKNENGRALLSAFYSTSGESANSTPGTKVTSGKVRQSIVVKPSAYESMSITPNNAVYYISTMVSNTSGKAVDESGVLSAKWVTLAVSVYYDRDTGFMYVGKDSPQIFPSYKKNSSNFTLPEETPLGSGQDSEELSSLVRPTVEGFIAAFANSTPDSHSELNQYIKDTDDFDLTNGFGGEYFVSKDELASAPMSVFPVDPEDPKELKVSINLRWYDSTSTEEDSLGFNGRYIMTLEKSSDGKYFVSAFRPYVYN